MNIWRLDPKYAGISSAVGDIGTHAHNLARYVTGLEVEALCADLTTFGKGYELEDDANILVHFTGGARGIIYASQISAGEENGLRLRVYGTKAGLDWRQENPNYLDVLPADGPAQVYKRGNDYLAPIAKHNSRIPSGHPEGFIEAFANIYRNAARVIAGADCRRLAGRVRHRLPDGAGRRARRPLHSQGGREREGPRLGRRALHAAQCG